jgi:hypothetical protein
MVRYCDPDQRRNRIQMDTATIVAALDAEIETLQRVRVLLSEDAPQPSATGFAFGVNRPRKM